MQAKKKNEFLIKRAALSANLGKQEIYDVVDHWPLYVGTRTLARSVEILDVFRSVLNIQGDIAEFGSHKGANVMYLAKLAQIYGVLGQKAVHCFDSFQGLTRFAENDGAQESNFGRYKGSQELLGAVVELFGYESAIKVHPGFIENTLVAFINENPDHRFSFIYFDADLYEPCRIVLSLLHDRLSVGGVFVFDEYGSAEWPGEARAVDEFLEKNDQFSIERPTITNRPGLIVRRNR